MKYLTTTFLLILIVAGSLFGQTSGNMFVTAYYPDWSIWTMKPWQVDYTAMTHIIHFSADPDPTTAPYFSPITVAADSIKLQYGSGSTDRSINFQDSLIIYAHRSGVKVLICIGGIYGTSDGKMDQICADIGKIRIFVSSIASYCRRKGYDGVDVDWEFPNNQTDYANLITTLRDTLNAWPTPGVIVAAVNNSPSNVYLGGNVALMNAKVDQINIMNYDMGLSTSAGFNAPLNPGECKYSGGSWTAWTLADHGIDQWINAGFSRSKLALGIPLYAWEFTGVDGPCQPRTGGQSYRTYANALSYLSQYPASYRWDDSAKVPYLSFTDGSGVKHMVSYDDSISLGYKVNWAKSRGVGGIMLYELQAGWVPTNAAGQRDPLLQAVKRAVANTFVPPPPPSTPPAAPSPSAPADLALGVSIPAALSWTASAGAASYRVQVSASSSFGTTTADQGGLAGTSFALGGLSNGTVYYWRVSAANAAGTSSWSSTRSFTTAAAVQPPQAPVLNAPADAAAEVSTPATLGWNAATGASTYQLQVSSSSAFGTTVANQTGISGTSFAAAGLSASTTYYWRVNASNAGGASAWSSVRSFTTAAVVAPPPSSGSMFVTAYYPDWSIWTMKPWQVDFTAMTHIIHFSADPDPTTAPYFSPITIAADSIKLQYGANSTDRSINYQDSLIIYAHRNGVKALICIGGIYGTSDGKMDQVCADINKIKLYVGSISAYCRRKGYDGVDVDWEFPNNPTDYANLITVLRDTLNTWPTPGIITAAVYMMPTNPYLGANVALMNSKVDQINLMNYDMGVSTYAGYNAPVKPGECKYAGGNWSAWTLQDHSVDTWVNAGFDKSKISLGVPLYAWEFTGVDGPCQLRTGGQSYRSYANALSYLSQYPNSYRWDDSSKVPYLSFTDGSGVKHMVSYDDSISLGYKVNWAKNKGVGGIMLYELLGGWVASNAAGQRDPLLQAVKRAVGNSFVPPAAPGAPALNLPADAALNIPTSTTLSWTASGGATSYRVQVSASSSFGTTAADQSGLAGTSFTVGGLSNGTVYYWRASAANSGGASVWSALRSFTTAAPPPPPAAPSLSAPADAALDIPTTTTLGWNAAAGASAYRVQVSLSTLFDTFVADQSVASGTSYDLSGLSNSAVYFWRVSASNAGGTSAWSAGRSFTTADLAQPPPPAPGETIASPAVLRDDFNRTDGPLPGTSRWIAVANFPNNGTLAVSSNALVASNSLGANATGGVAWDTLMTGGTEASLTLRQKSGSYANPSLCMYARMNGKDYATASGYRMDYREQVGSDIVEIRRVTNGLANSTVLAATTYELNAGDVITFRVLADNKTMIGLVNGIKLLTVADSVNTAPQWYFVFCSTVFPTAARFDDFRVSPTPAAAVAVAATPANLDFGKVGVGQTKRDSITVTNQGGSDITVSQVRSTIAQYVVTSAGGAIPPGASKRVYVDFTPNARSTYSGRIAIVINSGTASDTALVTGRGVAPPRLRHASTQVNFGAIPTESLATDSMVVYNDGELDLTISNIVSTNAVFAITPTSTTIAPADSQIFLVTAQPNISRAEDGYFVFYYNGDPAVDSLGVHLDKATFVPTPPSVPGSFALAQNYPNPFNPSTTIAFAIAERSVVFLKVFDALGREVAALVNGELMDQGAAQVRFDASGLPSGMYFYRLMAQGVDQRGLLERNASFTSMKKMVLVR